MNNTETKFPAKYTVFWPGQTVHVCAIHFTRIVHLAEAMGMPTPDSREEPDHECLNCVKESS